MHRKSNRPASAKASVGGQVMIITVLVLSVTALTAGVIASLLTVTQLRQARGITDSTKAIYAADSGIELGLYRSLVNSSYPEPIMTNGASFQLNVVSGASIRSLGRSGNALRAFSLTF